MESKKLLKTRIHRFFLRILVVCLPSAIGGGCAMTTIDTSTDPKSVETIQDADDYLLTKSDSIAAKGRQLEGIGNLARAGTFVGALGLGASALAGLHKDAAIGFATLGAISLQGLPLFGPPAFIPTCGEAEAALECLSGLAGPLKTRYVELRHHIASAELVNSRFIEYQQRAAKSADEVTSLNRIALPRVVSLRVAIFEGKTILETERGVASELFKSGRAVVLKFNDLLRQNQPSIGAFQAAGLGIVSQATAASDAARQSSQAASKAKAAAGAGGAGAAPELAAGPKTAFEIELQGLADEATISEGAIEKAIRAIGDASLDGKKVSACNGLLLGTAAPMVISPEPPSEGVQLGNQVEKNLIVSGGSGIHSGTWLGTTPPTDLLSYSYSAQSGGTRFVFKQLKKSNQETTFTMLVSDTAAAPQKKEVKIRVPKEQ